MQANRDRFAQLRCNLMNNTTKHVDNYPKNIVNATRMLNDYKSMKVRVKNGGDQRWVGVHTRGRHSIG